MKSDDKKKGLDPNTGASEKLGTKREAVKYSKPDKNVRGSRKPEDA